MSIVIVETVPSAEIGGLLRNPISIVSLFQIELEFLQHRPLLVRRMLGQI